MSLLDLILTRRSIRSYENKEIPEEVLMQILETGRQAPSAANRQPVHFIVVKDYEIKKKLCTSQWFRQAPVIIVGCAEKSLFNGKLAVIDCAAALENMIIAARALGIGSCWIGGFTEAKIKMLLKIPFKWGVVAMVTFGYPAEQPKFVTKKSFKELFSFNSF